MPDQYSKIDLKDMGGAARLSYEKDYKNKTLFTFWNVNSSHTLECCIYMMENNYLEPFRRSIVLEAIENQ